MFVVCIDCTCLVDGHYSTATANVGCSSILHLRSCVTESGDTGGERARECRDAGQQGIAALVDRTAAAWQCKRWGADTAAVSHNGECHSSASTWLRQSERLAIQQSVAIITVSATRLARRLVILLHVRLPSSRVIRCSIVAFTALLCFLSACLLSRPLRAVVVGSAAHLPLHDFHTLSCCC